MSTKKLFNPQGDDTIQGRTIIHGDTTNLLNLNEVKYQWATGLYRVMTNNTWFPEKVNLTEDTTGYANLTEDEARAYKGILSFLIFLDSIQTNNLPNFNDYITAPEVNLILAIQTYQEAIHSQSYQTILESIVPKEERDEILYFWRDDKILLDRNKYIGDIYEELRSDPSDHTLFKSLVANFLLESLYFYNGFAFFDTLADQGKMVGSEKMIAYIRRDELTHITIFSNIMMEIKKEFPDVWGEQLIYDMVEKAVEQEIEWSNHILGDKILGINTESIENYTKWLANDRLKMLKMKPLYKKVVNPYKHLERFQEMNDDRTNFFESTVINYTQSSGLAGSWDDF
ncbi:MAG: ribonucleotide-diphosphate reductase subunit beta [Patescibacteria group bacterium]|nr:ribonucleotide-diphosphate reductase subunit beta [Patescibacteria group bacterium]